MTEGMHASLAVAVLSRLESRQKPQMPLAGVQQVDMSDEG